jgi:hypothetical protein
MLPRFLWTRLLLHRGRSWWRSLQFTKEFHVVIADMMRKWLSFLALVNPSVVDKEQVHDTCTVNKYTGFLQSCNYPRRTCIKLHVAHAYKLMIAR